MSEETIRPEDDVEAHGPIHGGPIHGGPTHGGPTHGGPTHGAVEDDDADFEAHGPIHGAPIMENTKNTKNAK